MWLVLEILTQLDITVAAAKHIIRCLKADQMWQLLCHLLLVV